MQAFPKPLRCISKTNAQYHTSSVEALFVAHIQHEPAIDLHLLVLVILELQATDILLHARDLGAVERCGFGIARQDELADGVVRQDGIGGRDGDERCGEGFVDLPRGAVFVWLGVLDFVPTRRMSVSQSSACPKKDLS